MRSSDFPHSGPIPILGLEQVGTEGENHLNVQWFISPADAGRARGFKVRLVK